jgi:hypothetical protein
MPVDALGSLLGRAALGFVARGVLLSCSPSSVCAKCTSSLTSSLMRWHQILRSSISKWVESNFTLLRESPSSVFSALICASAGACRLPARQFARRRLSHP